MAVKPRNSSSLNNRMFVKKRPIYQEREEGHTSLYVSFK